MDTTGKCEKAKSNDLDRFVSEQNIARFRNLLKPETGERERRTILQLLKEESAQLRDGIRPAALNDIRRRIGMTTNTFDEQASLGPPSPSSAREHARPAAPLAGHFFARG